MLIEICTYLINLERLISYNIWVDIIYEKSEMQGLFINQYKTIRNSIIRTITSADMNQMERENTNSI